MTEERQQKQVIVLGAGTYPFTWTRPQRKAHKFRCHWANDCSPDFGKKLSGRDHRGGDPYRPEDHQIYKSLGGKFISPDSYTDLIARIIDLLGCESCQYCNEWNVSSRFVILWFARTWISPQLPIRNRSPNLFGNVGPITP